MLFVRDDRLLIKKKAKMKIRQENVIASRPAKCKSEGDEWIPFAVKRSSAPDRSGLTAFLSAEIVKNGFFVRKGSGAHTPPLKFMCHEF